MAQAKIKTFQCPSDNVSDDTLGTGVGIVFQTYNGPNSGAQAATAVIWYFSAPSNQLPAGRTNYTGVAGANGVDFQSAWTVDTASNRANATQNRFIDYLVRRKTIAALLPRFG